MASPFDLSALSEAELTDLIEAANMERNRRRVESARERMPDENGSMGQDVNDPGHGAITTPTPHAVRDHAPDEDADQGYGDGERGSQSAVEQAARRVV
ncbi:hypothetical protein [Rhizobium wuzhouense]|uniref:hypothetical protein n=1 Tax=Rhizobium wuzhouense TaxID=1986026 RepID=UPI00197ED135|nr:hypothetical protein [Rhizobium wuzhouense]